MSEFRKWLDISAKLFEEEVEEDIRPISFDDEVVDDESTDIETDGEEYDDKMVSGSSFGFDHVDGNSETDPEDAEIDKMLNDPLAGVREKEPEMDVSELIADIDTYQTSGQSNAKAMYDIAKLQNAPVETIKRIHAKVTGSVE